MTRFRFLIWLFVALCALIVLYAAAQMQRETRCAGLEIRIKQHQDSFFIDQSDVESMIREEAHGNNLTLPDKDIDLQQIEAHLESNPYIAKAEAYIDANQKLWVDIEQHQPIVRIIDARNLDYYLSKEGNKMPATNNFTSRVPVATGNINDNGKDTGKIALPPLQNIFQLAQIIDNDQFLKSLVEQIYAAPNGDLILIPKIGNHEIIIGNLDNIEEKIKNLHVFYQEALPNVGWDKYQSINLKFKGQIVAKRR